MSRRKLGIYTLNDNDNYGNRLQNYAVHQILNKYGDCENAVARYPDLKHQLKYYLWKITVGIIGKIFIKKSFRVYHFYDFNKNMKYASKQREYDYYFYGSDQIWNPTYGIQNLINPNTPKSKNVSISASIGINNIPCEYENIMKEGLNKFEHISVREDKAAEIVERYVGKKPVVLIDPTMYLDKKVWEKIEKKPKYIFDRKYVLLYFLGTLSDVRKKEINEFASKHNAIILDIRDKEYWNNTSPSEFLYLIHHCMFMITDSFHGSIFSILFEKPFGIYKREDTQLAMNCRIETLLKKFRLENKQVTCATEFEMEHDYRHVFEIIKGESKKLDQYLDTIFNQNEAWK